MNREILADYAGIFGGYPTRGGYTLALTLYSRGWDYWSIAQEIAREKLLGHLPVTLNAKQCDHCGCSVDRFPNHFECYSCGAEGDPFTGMMCLQSYNIHQATPVKGEETMMSKKSVFALGFVSGVLVTIVGALALLASQINI